MTYISAALSEDRKYVNVWERHGDKIITKRYDAPYEFYVKNVNGKYKDIYGNSLEKKQFDSPYDFYETRKMYKEKNVELYESDINPIYKILSTHYYNKETEDLHVSYFDIEVDYDKTIGFASVNNPYAEVSAISLYHHYSDRMLLLVKLPENGKWSKKDIPVDLFDIAEIVVCKTEKELLLRFLDEIDNSDVLSGWNSSGYDIPYLYMRMQKRYGESMANRLSFHNAPKPRIKEIEVFVGQKQLQVDIFGRVHLDYLEIFKKFETTTRPSFTLDAISEEFLPNLKKIEYEGSLYDLYNDNFPLFCRYNVRDTEVLKGFEQILGYMGIAIETYHNSTALAGDVLGSVKLIESNIINKCHHVLNVKIPDAKEKVFTSEKFDGAFVLDPAVGMHEWVASVDVNSLYPSVIRTLNISPETIVGQFTINSQAFKEIVSKSDKLLTLIKEDDETESHTASEWSDILRSRGWSISGYGTVFSQEHKGFIPAILEEWYAERKHYKSLSSEASEKAKSVDPNSKEYEDYKREAAYYNRKQFRVKILLNSFYGVTGNEYFKFYDIRMAASTTLSGREVLMHMVKTIAKVVDGEYQYPSPSFIYSDTDSGYFKLNIDNIEDALRIVNIVVKKVNSSFVDLSKNTFACKDEYANIIKADFDVISDKCIFVKKKYYVMHTLYVEGKPKDSMKIMGLQIKKTTLPKEVRNKMSNYLEKLLKYNVPWNELAKEIVEYKKEIYEANPVKLGLPKGVKGVEKYTAEYELMGDSTRLPGHVAASIFYNKCLEYYDDKESQKIISGMKIKTYYLKKKFGKFKSIALPTEVNDPPQWFKDKFMPIIDKDAQVKRLIDDPLQTVLSAIGQVAPTPKTIMVDELFEF